MHFHQGCQRFVTASDFADYMIDAFDWLWPRAEGPKMLSIGLHLRMIGRPGRIAGLERMIGAHAGEGRRLVRHAPADRRALDHEVRWLMANRVIPSAARDL